MIPGERFKNWIDGLAEAWKDRLRGWVASSLGFGIEVFFNVLGKSAAPKFKPLIDMLEQTEAVPPELKPLLDELKEPQGEVGALLANSAGGSLIGAGIGRIMDYVLRPLVGALSRRPLFSLLDPGQLLVLWLRKKMVDHELKGWLQYHGYDDPKIEHLKELAKVYPSPRDVVDFLAHEVFEADMVSKYSLLSEWDQIDKEFAAKIGLAPDILKLYWMDHWKHPEWGTIRELRHRDNITDQDVKDWFRLVEIPEYWRDPMLEVLWNLPNRIEIRMMARYLDMSKEEIMALLKKAGLHEDFRADAADFMMIMGLTGYWADMLSKGWMSPEEVKEDIDTRGFKPVTAERLYKRLVKASQPEKVTEARDLTVAQIIRWVKLDERGRRAQGVELLVDLNYNMEQADFIMEGYLGEMGSPETFEDFKNITQKYRKAIGGEGKPMTDELKAAAAEVVKLTKDIEALQAAIKDEEAKLVGEEILPEAATAKRDELRVALHRAESALAMASSNYDKLLAEWRHKEG